MLSEHRWWEDYIGDEGAVALAEALQCNTSKSCSE
jgi:hypothetical protein